MIVQAGTPAPPLSIREWAQGDPMTLNDCVGRVVLIEVFQVNCPGCFLYGLPEAVEAISHFSKEDLQVIGLATAFEDFELNTIDHLRLLLEEGEVIGETRRALEDREWLVDGKLRYRIPFPVAVDRLSRPTDEGLDRQVDHIIRRDITNYERFSYGEQARIRDRIRHFLLGREWVPETFERYGLHGTPTSILIDRNGFLRYKIFGADGQTHTRIRELLKESHA